MDEYLYLIIDLGAIMLPLVFSLHPRIRFDRQWRAFWPANLVVAAVFILWDVAFTRMGVWGFNPRYVTGIELFGLPLEEVLFFICIPYACLFTYHILGTVRPDPWWPGGSRWVGFVLVFLFAVVGLLNMGRWYTSTTFLALAGAMLVLLMFTRPTYMGRFFASYAVILIPFFLINGLLTGSFIPEEVVWYDNKENIGIRLGTIPVEDAFYGMLLLLLNTSFFEAVRKRVQ